MVETKKLRRRLPRRWIMFRLADAFASMTEPPEIKHGVLILRMFGIGDALLFRAVLEKYAEALKVPMSEITVLGSTAWASAAELFFKDVRIELIDEKRFTRNFWYRLKIMRDLRKRGFKTAICGMRLRYPHAVDSLMLASGAKDMIVAQPRPNEKFDAMFAHYLPCMTRVIALPEVVTPRNTNGRPLPLKHELEQQLSFLSTVAGKPLKLIALPHLNVPEGPAPLVGAGEKYAVLNIGASHAPRRWPLEHFFTIARQLQEQDYMIVFLGGPAELEIKDQATAFAAGTPRIIVSFGDLDLSQAAQLINQAALIVSNDSGLGHLAIMLSKPTVVIVGGGHFGSFMPYPQALTPPQVRVLYHLMPCYHCDWNCIMMPPGGKTFPCVGNVSADQVWQALTDILNPQVNG